MFAILDQGGTLSELDLHPNGISSGQNRSLEDNLVREILLLLYQYMP